MGQKLVSPATYWRRRVTVLAAAVVVLGLPIWAVSEAFGGSQAPGQGPSRSHGDLGARPRADPGHGQAPARETADLGSRPRVRPPAAAHGAGTAPSAAPGRQACARVLLTLRSAQHRYGPGERVTFVIGAASTNRRPCRLDLGPRFTSVVVAFRGTPLWDSSSCLRGAASRVVVLRRGAPAFVQVTWDRRTSLSGCPGQGTGVRPGTYTAAAFHDQLHSQAAAFTLSGRAAARP